MNIDRALHSLEIEFPEPPDVVPVVLRRLGERTPTPWWQRPAAAAAAVVVVIVVAVVGLVPAARDQVASWLGIRGVTIETVVTTSSPPAVEPTATSTPPLGAPVASGLGEGLVLGQEIVSLTVASVAGFEPVYPSLGLPDREFVDAQGRAWMLYSARPGLPETAVDGVGMIVTEFPFDSPGITKRIAPEGVGFVDFGDGLYGIWVPGPHDLELLEADGSVVDGRSAGNTLLWEQGELTVRMETALSRQEAIAIAESFR